MDIGAFELQIFVSLVVVLGAAFVALVCDYLKGNNEQLRERNIELRVRREEQGGPALAPRCGTVEPGTARCGEADGEDSGGRCSVDGVRGSRPTAWSGHGIQ